MCGADWGRVDDLLIVYERIDGLYEHVGEGRSGRRIVVDNLRSSNMCSQGIERRNSVQDGLE